MVVSSGVRGARAVPQKMPGPFQSLPSRGFVPSGEWGLAQDSQFWDGMIADGIWTWSSLRPFQPKWDGMEGRPLEEPERLWGDPGSLRPAVLAGKSCDLSFISVQFWQKEGD